MNNIKQTIKETRKYEYINSSEFLCRYGYGYNIIEKMDALARLNYGQKLDTKYCIFEMGRK